MQKTILLKALVCFVALAQVTHAGQRQIIDLSGTWQIAEGGYSRPGGYTSDNFVDINTLNYEPSFHKYVRDAFSPVGVMVDFWKSKLPADAKQLPVPVVVINDLYEPWQGKLTLTLVSANRVLWSDERTVTVQPLGQQTVPFDVRVPEKIGTYQLVARLDNVKGEVIQSLRDFARVHQ